MNSRIRPALCLCFLVLGLFLMEHTSYAACTDPLYLFGKRVGGTTSDAGYGLAVDASGNAFVTGFDLGTVDFGGGPIPNAGGHDAFLVKYNSNGVHQWSKGFGGTFNEWGRAVAVDASGNVFVTGSFQGTVNFGGSNLVSNGGSSDIFLAKYDSNGNHLWSQGLGGPFVEEGFSLATDASGNVFLTGYFGGTVNLGGANLTSAGGEDIFLAKYNASGVHQWSQRFGGTSDDEGKDVAVDGSGNVVMVGKFQNAVNFGGSTLTSAGSSDVFVAKYNSSGVHQWSQRFGGSSVDASNSVATDVSGNVVITGYFDGTINFGGSTLTSFASTDIFLAKFNAGGTHQWSESFPGSGSDIALGVAVDAASNIVITGYFLSGPPGATINFGGSTLIGAGLDDLFLAKFLSSGVHQWSMAFGTGGDEDGNGVATDGSGNVYVAGYLSGNISLGGPQLVGLGGFDVFLAKYSPDPVQPCIQSIVDVGNDQGRQVKISFLRSGYDRPGAPVTITGYEAYRRDDPPPPVAASTGYVSSGAPSVGALAAGWEFVGSVPAHGESDYLIGAPTVGDSTLTHGQYYSVFYIRAVTSSPFVFYDSPPDSGYSVDNLAPAVPASLVFDAGVLSWDTSPAGDFDHFTVYGSNGDAFASATVIQRTAATTMDVAASPYHTYFVTASDVSGNESQPAVTSGSGHTPGHCSLAVSAYPNPFNPRTTIRYDVPSAGRVVVGVYDARGGLVATLVDRERSAGSYAADWEGRDDRGAPVSSGVYFVRVEFDGRTMTRKLALVK